MDDAAPTFFGDDYRNFVAKLGTTSDKAEGGHHVMRLLSDAELLASYRSSWLARKVVDIIADDATREWRLWNTQDKKITDIEDEEKRLRLKETVRSALRSARLFGMAAIHFAIDGDTPDDLAEPLDPLTIGKGGISHLTVIPRRNISVKEISNDPLSQYFGEPEFYEVFGSTIETPQNMRVSIHASRLIIFRGQDVPAGSLSALYHMQQGDSVLQSVMDTILKADGTMANIASLIFEAKVDVIGIPNLNKAVTNPRDEQALINRFTLASFAKSNNSLLLLDAQETYDRKQMNFGTLPEIADRFFQNVAGAADIPMTRLYGMSPAGLNATGESDLKNYYDRVRVMQELEIDPPMSIFNTALKVSAMGRDDDTIFHEWRPLWQMSEKERVDVGKIVTEIGKNLTGVVTPEAISEGVSNALIEYSVLPGLEEAIDQYGAIPPEPSPEEMAAMMARGPATAGARPKPKLVVNNRDELITLADATPRTLYVRRDVKNVAEINAWAKSQGFKSVVNDLHVTIIYSKAPVDWMKFSNEWEGEEFVISEGGPRMMEQFGQGATVLTFGSNRLRWRNEEFREAGASTDYPDYQPHITISYEFDGDISTIKPYQGKIVLGPEIFEEIDDDFKSKITEDEKPEKEETPPSGRMENLTPAQKEWWRRYAEANGLDPDEADWLQDRYDPNQPRDDHGRWTSGAGASGAAEASGGRGYRPADEAAYKAAATAAKASQGDHGLAVDVATGADAYFVAENGMSSFAMKGNDFVGLASHRDNPQRGVAKEMVEVAVKYAKEKGYDHITLDCFEPLPKLYSRYGFEEVERVPFDWNYAPDGWEKRHGEPDVVFMRKNI